MAKIMNVDYEAIPGQAKQIRATAKQLNSEMTKAYNSIAEMHNSWYGKRYNELVKSNVIKYNSLIEDALYFHDFGKPFCHTTDENGISHYYNHNNVGAYLFLCNLYSSIMFLEREKIKVAKLIEWHMLELTEKAIKRRRIENTEYPQMLKIIQECDKYRKVDK